MALRSLGTGIASRCPGDLYLSECHPGSRRGGEAALPPCEPHPATGCNLRVARIENTTAGSSRAPAAFERDLHRDGLRLEQDYHRTHPRFLSCIPTPDSITLFRPLRRTWSGAAAHNPADLDPTVLLRSRWRAIRCILFPRLISWPCLKIKIPIILLF